MPDDGDEVFQRMFADPAMVEHYTQGPPRFTPGLDALQRMAAILLAEYAPADAHVLVLGAGGGLELRSMAQAQPGWRFTGVDPAQPMLDLAVRTMGDYAPRATMVHGTIDAAPVGPFDAATCLLTLHFLPRGARVDTLRHLHRRLTPGAPLVVAHSSFPQHEPDRSRWLQRYAAFAVASGVDPETAEQARAAVSTTVSVLTPDDDEACLREAGFHTVEMFYAAFTWRGWSARA